MTSQTCTSDNPTRRIACIEYLQLGAIRKKIGAGIFVGDDVIQATTVNVVLNQFQALSTTRSVELAMSGVSCVLNWHVLSEGQVHYKRGHMSLECVDCRVC